MDLFGGSGATGLGAVLHEIGSIYLLILFARAILSWFPYAPDSPINGLRRVVFTLTEPVLAPFRKLIPPVGMIDVSFIVAIIVVGIIVSYVLPLA